MRGVVDGVVGRADVRNAGRDFERRIRRRRLGVRRGLLAAPFEHERLRGARDAVHGASVRRRRRRHVRPEARAGSVSRSRRAFAVRAFAEPNATGRALLRLRAAQRFAAVARVVGGGGLGARAERRGVRGAGQPEPVRGSPGACHSCLRDRGRG